MSQRLRSNERKNVFSDTSPSTQQQFIYIEIPVNKDDNLVLISMKYGVTIPELKRINSLQNERDIYALSCIKIPIKPNSILFHQYESQLKYGDPNMTRLSNRLDSSMERELADTRYENDDVDADELVVDENLTSKLVNYENGQAIYETEFVEENDTTALLATSSAASSDQPQRNMTQTKEAKKFFQKLDNNLVSLKNQNEQILKKSSSNSEQLIPITNLAFSIENTASQSSITNRHSNFFNTPDILLIAVFFMILLPIVIIIYRYYFYENGHNMPHDYHNH